MELFNQICSILLKLIGILSCYKVLYYVLGFLTKAKPLPEENGEKRRYGIVICARNEEKVIGNLIESLHRQTYDAALLTIFVCADNCSDRTAEICREMGCVVYERFCPQKARKGYALEFLFDRIQADYAISSFDGFFFFDADNLVKENFVEIMNRCFTEKTGILNGYRNTKNFATNMISAASGIHFYGSTVSYHRPRRFLNLSTHIAGTGFCVASRLLRNGWHCTCLTEDTEFTLRTIAAGERIDFVEQAEFFDEQPHNFFVCCRQRIRWAKGRLFAFLYTVGGLLKGIFSARERRFSCYDMFFYAFPASLLSAFSVLIYSGFYTVCSALDGTFFTAQNLKTVFRTLLVSLFTLWLSHTLKAFIICIRERRHIHCGNGKLIAYCLTYVWYDAIYVPLSVLSLFMHVKWKPIRHDDPSTIADLHASAYRKD